MLSIHICFISKTHLQQDNALKLQHIRTYYFHFFCFLFFYSITVKIGRATNCIRSENEKKRIQTFPLPNARTHTQNLHTSLTKSAVPLFFFKKDRFIIIK